MNLLTGYLMRTILSSTFLVLAVLLALAGLFQFIGNLDDVQGDFGMLQVFIYSMMRLPQISFEMLPMAALIGSLLGLGALANKSELVVMRTAGISVVKLSGMVALSGIVLLLIAALIGEFIAPPLDYFARNLRNEARFSQSDRASGNPAWVKNGDLILHLERVNSELEFGGVYMFRFNEDDSLQSVARAENAGIADDDRWVLENFRETRFDEAGVQTNASSVTTESLEVGSDVLGITLVKPVSLSARGLVSYVRYLRSNDMSSIRYEMELWSRIAATITVTLMPVLALAFVFGSLRSAGAGSRLMIGVMIGLGYFLASETLASSGQVFDLNPVLVTFIPTFVLFLITVIALSRVR